MNELKELEFDISEAEYEASKLLADGNMNDYLEMQDHITSLKLRRDRLISQKRPALDSRQGTNFL